MFGRKQRTHIHVDTLVGPNSKVNGDLHYRGRLPPGRCCEGQRGCEYVVFDRRLVLPDGFTPLRIKVEVRSRTRSISSIEESFAWATSQS